MENTGSSPGVPADSTAVATRGRYTPEDPLIVERRRKQVARLRFVEHLTEREIVNALATLAPDEGGPIKASQATVSRDLHLVRKQFRHYLSVKGFDPADEVYRRLAEFEERAHIAMRHVRASKDGQRIAALIRAANDSSRSAIRLLQEVGLLDRKLGTLIVDDGRKSERVPSGLELQKLFDSVNVVDAELVSEAEEAWKYGDAAASEKAARAATDSARDGD